MDAINSIDTGCCAVTDAIVKTSPALRLFIREVREARTELDAVLAELHSLQGVIDILKDDAGSFPSDLATRTPPLLEHCSSILSQIDGYMHVCNGLGLSKRDKKFRWLAIRADMVKLRFTLEGYKSILALVTDLVGLTKSRKDNDMVSLRSDSSRYHDALEDQTNTNDDIKAELTHVLADMGSLRGRLQGDFRSNYAVSDLESYLDAMQLDATNLGHRMNVAYRMKGKVVEPIQPLIPGKSADRGTRFSSSGASSSMGDEPDSAIDINDGPPSPYQPSPTVDKRPEQDGRPAPPNVSSLPIVEIDEFLDELSDERSKPSRAPTPPPKARARHRSVTDNGHSMLGGSVRPAPSVRSVSDYGAMAPDADEDEDARSTLGSLMGIRPPFSEAGYSGYDNNNHYNNNNINNSGNSARDTTPTTLVAGEPTAPRGAAAPTPQVKDSRLGRSSTRLFSRKSSFSVPGRATRPETSDDSASRPTSRHRSLSMLNALSAPGAALALPAARLDAPAGGSTSTKQPAHGRKASADTNHTVATTSSGGGGKAPRSSMGGASSIRSSSSRMSSVFARMTLWKPSRIKEEPTAEETEPDDIFGVSLKKSMQMASATVRTHHNGSKGSSCRQFPRVVLTCVSFIKENDGIRAPNVFGEDFCMGNDTDHLMRVAELKQCFSTAPHYGDGNIAWEQYDVYDAAELIVLFLQQMPKPLITETIAKRWIVLSRQASLPGSMGLRLDSCIDFWDEALLGVRGPARSMFKLLLNLWGDIADAADVNDMTAERLAARMLNPLMHLPAGRYTTDLMLGLAFLIRKRSEYAIMLREGRPSKAAF